MFENIGWAEILVLVVAGLFILGPERLPDAAKWVGKTIRQVRQYATGARDHLRNEMGPEFDQLQQPLNDLRSLRNFNPRTAITRTLFSDDEPEKPNGFAPGANGNGTHAGNGAAAPSSNGAEAVRPAPPERLASGERPPVDPDAT